MTPDFTQLTNLLNSSGIEFLIDLDMAAFSYMRTGGVAHVAIFPKTKDEFSNSISFSTNCGVPFKVIGNTSNLLFLDNTEYSCLIITTKLNCIRMETSTTIFAEAGVMIPDLARFALFHHLTGMEGLEGIPGTLGGGVFMNAGAYGSEIKDCLVSLEAINIYGESREYSSNEIALTHRSSLLRKEQYPLYVYACRFDLKNGDERSIYGKMEAYHAKRHRYQDFIYPNLGSIFSGSPYRAMEKRDWVFGIALRVFMFLGYKLKVLGRESPINRRWINDLAVRRFKLKYSQQPFSDKTINCLVNRGQGTAEMVRFIRELEAIIDGRAPLENEIVEKF